MSDFSHVTSTRSSKGYNAYHDVASIVYWSDLSLGSSPPRATLFQMESPEVDIKPTIPMDDIQDKSLLTVPGAGKLKQSRYEDVWPDDVHAAFMEGRFFLL